jgi:DNA repair photolyase
MWLGQVRVTDCATQLPLTSWEQATTTDGPAIQSLPEYGEAARYLATTAFIGLDVKSIINPPENTGMGFWSLNPYVGCEFGCTYCYARYTHRYVMERVHTAGQVSNAQLSQLQQMHDGQGFERLIFVKRRRAVLTALERDLMRINRRNASKAPSPIVIGTATDPYQPAEQRFHLTRAILRRLLITRGLTIGLITKSPHIQRDIDLLRELHTRHRLVVYMSLISIDVNIIKQFEVRSPMPHVRLRTLRKLRDAGLIVGLSAAPVLPGITDSAFQIDALMAAAHRSGASFVHPSVMRFYPVARECYVPIIKKHFANLVNRYRAAYRGSWDAPRDYVAAVQQRFQRIARKHGMDTDDPLQIRDQRLVKRETQLSLL